MKIFRLIPLLVCFLSILSPTIAQDVQNVEDTGWPVEERCVGEPTPPPADWTFPGAILMTGHYGIHAVSADVPTPYVVAFLNKSQIVQDGSGLSPDGKWYAASVGNIRMVGDGAGSIEVNQIRVINTANPKDVYEIPWKINYLDVGLSLPTPTLVWWDQSHLIYMNEDGSFAKINPFTGATTNFQLDIVPRDIGKVFFQSPDWKRVLLKDNTHFQDQNWTLYDPSVSASQLQTLSLASFPQISWSRDSSQFVTETEHDNEQGELTDYLELFDRDGTSLDVIFLESNDRRVRGTFDESQNIRWSPDGRYLGFITTTLNYPTIISLYVADMQEKRVYNTCIEPGDGLAWSPDGTKLAMMDFYDYKPHRPVMVLDLETWSLYTVAYHNGNVIGWRDN